MSEKRTLSAINTSWLLAGWLLLGQVMMQFVLSDSTMVVSLLDHLDWTRHLFPTIGNTNGPYVFSAVLASSYLSLMGLLFPAFLVLLFLVRPMQVLNTRAKPLIRFRTAYGIGFLGLALYCANFRWDDGFFVRVLAWHPVGFSVGGALLFFLLGYGIRAAHICVVMKENFND